MQTSLELIDEANRNGWLRELVFYYQVKARFSNSCLYNYRCRVEELSHTLGVSRSSFYKYLHKLSEVGLVREHSRNLIFNPIRDYCNRRQCYHIEIHDSYSPRQIMWLLLGKLLEHKAICQKNAEEYHRYLNGDDHRKSTNGENLFKATMSIRTISRHLGVSISAAHRIVKGLNEMGVLRTEIQKPYVIDRSGIPAKYYPEDRDELGYRFQIDGILFEQMGSQHSFLLNPLIIPPQSLTRWKILRKRFVQKK